MLNSNFLSIQSHRKRLVSLLKLFCLSISATAMCSAQSSLAPREIARAKQIGRNTEFPLKLGTLVRAKAGGSFQAFVTTPLQRFAYLAADTSSIAHGSGAKDPLQAELHLNRIRVTGLPFAIADHESHDSRHVALCEATGDRCIKPAHEVLDAGQVVAEFEMPTVVLLASRGGTFRIQIQNDLKQFEPPILVSLEELTKSGLM